MRSDQRATLRSATQLLGEFDELVQEVQQTGDFEHFYQRFDRWKERAIDILQTKISPNEAVKLSRLGDRPNWVLMEPPDVMIMRHRAFLQSLVEDVEQHPDSFGGAPALAQEAAVVAAKVREAPPNATPTDPPLREATEPVPTAIEEPQKLEPPTLPPPERITPRWLWHNADMRWLIGAISLIVTLLISAFIAGVHVGASPGALEVVGPIVGVEAHSNSNPAAVRATINRDSVTAPRR